MSNGAIKIALIDDDVLALETLRRQLTGFFPGGEFFEFTAAREFEIFLARESLVNVLVIDAFLDDGVVPEGLRLVSLCRDKFPEAAIFIRSWTGDISVISGALKNGANDFIAKDASTETLGAIITDVTAKTKKPVRFDMNVIGATMTAIRERVPRIIESAVNCVYVEGESGTGKEVVADLFQSFLPSGTPFIRLNCATISPHLMMSELFGHEKGAFTGAASTHVGLIESAKGGWLFLDEIALLSPDAQAALLRAIDNQVIRRVGGNREIKVTFRVISATNEPLSKMVTAGTFRQDLWQRLRETEIRLPPLRERRGEIAEMIEFFRKTMRGGPYHLAPRVTDVLISYDWSGGNIRELRNTLRSMTEKSVGRELTPASIPSQIWEQFERRQALVDGVDFLRVSWPGDVMPEYESLAKSLLVEMIRRVYSSKGRLSVRALAKELGIPKSTLPARLAALIESGALSRDELRKLVDYAGD
jgi:DNA-binding NtrC family response regulator